MSACRLSVGRGNQLTLTEMILFWERGKELNHRRKTRSVECSGDDHMEL